MAKTILKRACFAIAFASIANIAQADDGFVILKGPEITELLKDFEDVDFPSDDTSTNSDSWRVTFSPNGSWDGWAHGGTTSEAFGAWYVKDNLLCIEIKGGNLEWMSPYEGCLNILVNRKKVVIAAARPKSGNTRFTMKEAAYAEIGRLSPSSTNTVAKASPPPQHSKGVANRNALKKQQLALERKQLQEEAELARMRLELERQKLELERQALAQQRRQQNQATEDRTKPVIQTTDTAATTEKAIRIAGIVRDDGRLARVEVAGRRVDVEGESGRFSATVPVSLGRNRITVSATDTNGNKAERVVLVTRKRDIPSISFGAYHAVVIGINDYEALPKLKTAVADARAVAATLKADYGYTVHLMENPTRADIIDKFDELRETLVEADNLLIYYAGHGWLDEQSGRGYWMPVNARNDRRSRWVSNATLTDALQALHAKHIMVVADSCYSGTLTRSVKVPERNRAYLERIAEKRARVVLSSGGLEPVADSGGGKHSVFAAQFLKALRANEGVLDGTQMFEQVRQTVVLNADQTPEYSDIRKAGHEGGDFLFVRKDE